MTDDSEDLPEQEAYTKAIVAQTPDNGIIVSNLGVSSWILSAVEDRPRNYYMKGAMGATTPVGLGLAMSCDEQVTVLDGDGSLLMSLGTLATISRQDPENLVVIVMNNSQFATTGGQPSLADEIDIASAAENCGLFSADISSLDTFEDVYTDAVSYDGTAVLNCNMRTTVPDEYPEPDYAHSFLKYRFRSALIE